MATASNSGAFNDDGTRALAGPVPQEIAAPDQYIKGQVNADIQRMQGVFEQQWKLIEGQKKYVGEQRVQQMLNQLTMAARSKVMMVKAQGQMKIDQMNGIRRLQEQGFLNNTSDVNPSRGVDRMLWSVAAGQSVAQEMFPREEPADTVKEFGKLSGHKADVQKQLDEFRIVPASPAKKSIIKPWTWNDKGIPTHVERMNRQTATYDSEGNIITGEWEMADAESIKKMGTMMKDRAVMEEALDRSARGEPIGIAGVGKLRRIAHGYITGQNTAGTLKDKIAASVLSRKIDRGQVNTASSKRIRVRHLASGQTGTIPESEFNEQEYERLQ